MSSRVSLLSLLLGGCVSSAAVESAGTVHQNLQDATDAFFGHAQRSPGHESIDLRWHRDLAALVKVGSPEAIDSLAKLGTFDLDGETSEIYGCAANAFHSAIADQLERSQTQDYCRSESVRRKIETLNVCASDSTVKRRIAQLRTAGHDHEAGCN